MKQKNLITWKQADQNLCKLAASILNRAWTELRSDHDRQWTSPNQTRGKGPVGFNFLTEHNQTWTTVASFNPDNELSPFWEDNDISLFEYADEWIDQWFYAMPGDYSLQCWWSFQNIIRWRLREARQALFENCYGRNPRKSKKVRIRSRNPSKRRVQE